MAGLTILLSTVALLFVIGFLIMIFTIMSGNLAGSSRIATVQTVTNETTFINATGDQLNIGGLNARGYTISQAINTTSGTNIAAANFTVSDSGLVTNATAVAWNFVSANYTFTFDANTTATQTILSTGNSIAGVTSWFPIIITITVMVCLILLTVIIIVAIRSSGLLAANQ